MTEDTPVNLKRQYGERYTWIVETYEKGNRSALARKLDMSSQGAIDLCNGKSIPGGDTLVATLLAYPRLSPEWLLLGKRPRERTAAGADRVGLAVEEMQKILDEIKQPQTDGDQR